MMTTRTVLLNLVLFTALSSTGTASADKTPTNLLGTTVVDAETVIKLVGEHPDIVIIDSRIPGDRSQGYIEGSVSLPDVKTDCASLAQTIPSKSNPTLFYCNGINCVRSANAIKIARACKYKNIYWFRGGFIEWKSKGYPFLQK